MTDPKDGVTGRPGFRAELRSFLRHEVLWWAPPILLVFLLFLCFALLGSGGESGFVYDLF